jgi:hypothetical protein
VRLQSAPLPTLRVAGTTQLGFQKADMGLDYRCVGPALILDECNAE